MAYYYNCRYNFISEIDIVVIEILNLEYTLKLYLLHRVLFHNSVL